MIFRSQTVNLRVFSFTKSMYLLSNNTNENEDEMKYIDQAKVFTCNHEH